MKDLPAVNKSPRDLGAQPQHPPSISAATNRDRERAEDGDKIDSGKIEKIERERVGPYNGIYNKEQGASSMKKSKQKKKKKKHAKIVYETYYPDLEKYEAEQKAKEEDRKLHTLEGYEIDAVTGKIRMLIFYSTYQQIYEAALPLLFYF